MRFSYLLVFLVLALVALGQEAEAQAGAEAEAQAGNEAEAQAGGNPASTTVVDVDEVEDSDDEQGALDDDSPEEPADGSEGSAPAPDMHFIYDGVLLVDGKQTSCMVAVISQGRGLVAANCLSDGTTEGTTGTDRLQFARSNNGTAHIVSISGFFVHPSYDATTLANNVAVAIFGSDQDPDDGTVPVPSSTTAWDDQCLFRRTIAEPIEELKFNDIQWGPLSNDTQDLCEIGSPIYTANTADFICDKAAVAPTGISDCPLPYGMGYGAIEPVTIYPHALYSHSVVFGDGLCSDSQKVHYYTVLRNYLEWGNAVQGFEPEIPSMEVGKANTDPAPIDFEMKPPASKGPVVKTYGGDLYTQIPTPFGEPEESVVEPAPTDEEPEDPQVTSVEDPGDDVEQPTESVPAPPEEGEQPAPVEPQPTPVESQPVESNPDGSDSTTTVEITSFVTITTYSCDDVPESSAPSGYEDCTETVTVDPTDVPAEPSPAEPETPAPTDDAEATSDCTEELPGMSDMPGMSSADETEGGEVSAPEDPDNENAIVTNVSTLVPYDPALDPEASEEDPDEGLDSEANDEDGESAIVSNVSTLEPYDPSQDPEATEDPDEGLDSEGEGEDEEGETGANEEAGSNDEEETGDNEEGTDVDGEDNTDADGKDDTDSDGEDNTDVDDEDNTDVDDEDNTDVDDEDNTDADGEDDESSTDPDDDSSPNNEDEETGGISHTTAILVGVLVPLAVIIIIACLYFYVKRK